MQRSVIFLLLYLLIGSISGYARQTDKILIKNCINRYLSEHNNFKDTADVWGEYTLDLTVEALINFTEQQKDTGLLTIIDRFFRLRNYHFTEAVPFKNTPFCDVNYSYAVFKKDTSFIKPYVSESYQILRNIARTADNAVCIEHHGCRCMLIDFLQNYIIRMARSSYLTGDTVFCTEIMHQLQLYSQQLQYSDSRLFSQGKGWIVSDTNQISPSAWLRGQGWMIRGLVTTLAYLPENSVYSNKVRSMLRDFVDGLIRKQHKNGMWYNLPLLPFCQSYPEVSGSAMIAHYLDLACSHGYLSGVKYRMAVDKTKKAIIRYIRFDFSISNISPGPGTLFETDKYKNNSSLNNPHGLQAIILLFSNP